MRTHLLKVVAFMLCFITIITTIGCAKPIEGEGGDSSKADIFFYYYDGDGKKDWIKAAAKEFNETLEDYEIRPVGTLNEDYEQNLISGGGNASIIEMTHTDASALINKGAIVNLEDLLDKEVDGKLLRNKVLDVDGLKALYSTKGKQGLYGIPTSPMPVHLIFDFELFKQNGWLVYKKAPNGAPLRDEENNLILTDGHDGISGTYDDGQPTTIEEWDEMIKKINVANNTKPFIYTTKYSFYLEPLTQAILASYGGLEECISILNGNGSYKDVNGQTVTVPISQGYEMYKAPSLLKTMEFMEDYICNPEYIHEKSVTSTSLTHKETVNYFISGFYAEVQQAGMMIEYPTFEDSNKYYFSLLESAGNKEYGYGKRDFRYMFLPRLHEGQDVSYVASAGMGTWVVSEDSNKERLQIAKDFLLFTLQDKYLQQYTLDNISVRPFDYSLSNEQLSTLTKFQRSSVEAQLDRENIKMITPLDYVATSANTLGFSFKAQAYQFSAMMADGEYDRTLMVLRRYSAKDYVDGIYKLRKEKMWGVAN